MAIPKIEEIEIPLLHLIYCLGGEVKPSDVYDILADYFELSDEERNELLPSGNDKKWRNRVRWVRFFLVNKGFLEKSKRGIWKITPEGKKELEKIGLINKPFPIFINNKEKKKNQLKQNDMYSLGNLLKKEEINEEEKMIDNMIKEIVSIGLKNFPEDFIPKNSPYKEIEVPGTELCIDKYIKTLVISPQKYFKYQTKNPVEAKYIIYANKLGNKTIKIPIENFIIFKAVISYEKYISDLIKKCFERFLNLTYDEIKSKYLTNIVMNKLGLKIKI